MAAGGRVCICNVIHRAPLLHAIFFRHFHFILQSLSLLTVSLMSGNYQYEITFTHYKFIIKDSSEYVTDFVEGTIFLLIL